MPRQYFLSDFTSKHHSKVIFLLFVFTSIYPYSPSHATPIYKWEDANGTTHFSQKPPSNEAKPEELPPINRGEVKLVKEKLETCDRHGGANCSLGPDSDGSVICYDGFLNAVTRFRFSCSAPKLEITDISEPRQDGSFSVFIRNSKSVKAQKPALLFRRFDGKEVNLEGPSEIESYGVAEFIYNTDALSKFKEKPNLAQLTLRCANCPS